jgi:cytochrome c-type biogenesis protein CcmF
MSFSPTWGNFFIVLSLIMSFASLALILMAVSGKESYAVVSKIFYLLTAVCIWFSMILLLYYFINGDFRYAYVYENSSSGLPLPYRIAALWAGKEGSFLVWLFFLNLCGMLVSRSNMGNARIVSAIIILTQIFLLAILIVESPYLLIWDKFPESISPGSIPGDGLGLNPLLRDPWMVAHPPVLFLGYASAVVPFAYAIAGLFRGDKDWIRDAYPWLLFSMITLGAGIFLGGYWAYSVLGWGGYWGWDAVENSSLIPWIISIALVHGFLVQKRTGLLVRTNLFLALLYFLLIFYSTWLTRSGVLSDFSVHSFTASKVSPLLLAFISICVLGPYALFVMRFKQMAGVRDAAQVTDWKTFTVYGILTLAVYALIILIGTSLPLISSAFMERPTSVTTEFYNNFSGPFGVLIIVLMILSTAAIVSRRLINLRNAVLVIVSIALGIMINAGFTRNPVAYIFTILSFLLLARSIYVMVKMKSKSLIPSRLSHIGVGLLIAGVITSNFHTTAVQKKLVKNIEYDSGTLRVTFLGLGEGVESSLRFAIQRGAKREIIETAYYIDSKTESLYKEPYIVSGFFNDLYIAPDSYESGAGAATHLMLSKGEERELSGVRVRFIEFRTEHMTSGEPATFADLTVNGINLSPGIRFTHDGVKHLDRRLPGSDRSISLKEIDATSKRIVVFISPGKNTVIPSDMVLISISTKRLIWLVWLGTVLIIIGGCYAFAKALKKK